ncbi:MAG: hypothetical protein JST63_09190 [Bacteroidetes bacterium]|nr:hypothetical protein [Bacteroidota bacterium]
MILLSLSDFIGRFHPVIVHLPIGILLLGVLLHWLSRSTRFGNLQPAVRIVLLLGAISAVISCISGWLLGRGGDYDPDILNRHRWVGIGTAVIAILYYLNYAKKTGQKLPVTLPYILSVLLLLLITFTGHLGGTLTHGEGYLTQDLFQEEETKAIKKIIPDVQQAVAYSDIIQPVLHNKCYSCHSSSKQKGKLRLDTKEFIEKGGKDGKVLVPGKSDESEVYERLLLDPLEKKHMPPKGRPQLTEAETNIIHWWINAGASFDQKVKDLPQDEKIKPVLLALQSNNIAAPSKPDVPETPVAAASAELIGKLKKAGITVIPVSAESNYLSVSFISVPLKGDSAVKLLESLAPQIVWLKLSDTKITDAAMTSVAKLTNLTRLSLDHTNITDKGVAMLQPLTRLQYFNIVATEITGNGLTALKGLQELQTIYIYQSGILKADSSLLRKTFPKAIIDTGGYQLPILEGDTSIVKKKND